jgi:predicted kinase
MCPVIILLVGLPGSGKSTWVAKQGAGALSSDAIRHLLADDATDQSIHHRVFATLRYLLRQRLVIRRPVTYIDATNLTPEERQPYVEIASASGAVLEAVFFDVPVEVCIQRNRGRDRVVPEDAIRTMAGKLRPPSPEEGFKRIRVISFRAKDGKPESPPPPHPPCTPTPPPSPSDPASGPSSKSPGRSSPP